MKEYEYSFAVDSADQYHAFCKDQQPLSTSVTSMRRRVYKDGSSVIARLTEESTGDDSRRYFDFKQDSNDSQIVKHVQETLPINLNEKSIDHYLKLLDTLDFKLDADLVKKRTRYQFKDVHVDIDEYTAPRKAIVIELEGKRKIADNLYARMTAAISSQ